MAALYLAVMPGRPGRDQFMGDTCRFQRNIKLTFFCVADVFIGEFRTIVCEVYPKSRTILNFGVKNGPRYDNM